MNIIEIEVPSNCDIVQAGDTHFGSVLCHEDGINEMIDWVADKDDRFLIHMGDWIEGRLMDDPKFNFETTKIPRPCAQRDHAIQTFWPLREKILFGLIGNHEFFTFRHGDMAYEICKGLRCPYGGYVTVATLRDKWGPMFSIYTAHGFGKLRSNAKDPEQEIGNLRAALKRLLRKKAADTLVMSIGHTHRLLTVRPTHELYITHETGRRKAHYLDTIDPPTSGPIPADMRWYVNTGSYQKLDCDVRDENGTPVSGYAERFGYDPMELGHAVLEIRDRKLVNIREVTA